MTPAPWAPYPAQPLGTLEGEAVWTVYLNGGQVASNGEAQPPAYRTFFQPDQERPYAVVAVVAINLDAVRLGLVLGFEEPYNPEAPRRSGKIPDEDRLPGRLLATFNGGFKAEHGLFGAMADGITVLPPKDGLGTVAIYQDGKVAMGSWGDDIVDSPDLAAWRQNGPLVIQDGQINPRVYNNSPRDWGYTLEDYAPTVRSGIAISQDGGTLYYFAGPNLTMEALAKCMLAVGAVQGIQLDINIYWAMFLAYDSNSDRLVPEPLLPDIMRENLDRYLYAYSRDYFYLVTADN
jgi:hypothetical protein